MKKDSFADFRENFHIIHRKTSDGHKIVIMEKIGTEKLPSDSMVSEPKNHGVVGTK